MSLKVNGAYVYDVDESKATYLLATGVLTAAPLFFTTSKPDMNEDAFGALVLGQDMYTRDQLLAKLAARPVFLVRGQKDRLALLIGPTGGADEIVKYDTVSHLDTVRPTEPWFITYAEDSGSAALNSTLLARSPSSTNATATWDMHHKEFADRVTAPLAQVGFAADGAVAASAASWQQVRDDWQNCVYGRGLNMIVITGYNGGSYLPVGLNHTPARGNMPCGIGFFGGGYDGKGGFRGIAEMDGHMNPKASGIENFGDLAVYKTNSDGGRHAMLVHRSIPVGGSFEAYVNKVSPKLQAMGLEVPTRTSFVAPYPLVTNRVGYVVGLPHEHSWFMMEFSDLEKELKVPGTGLYPSKVCTAVSGAVFKKLFPLDTITVPSDKTSAESSLAEIPDDLEIRATWIPEGIKYGTIDVDQTVAAVDMARAGESLDAIEFAMVEDGEKTITYGAMAGAASRAISKKKNAYAVFFAEGVVSDLSIGGVKFVKEGGSIMVRDANDNALASHDAHLRIKMGASASFVGCTEDEVAQIVFGFPTWKAMMEVGSSNKGSYSFDETALTDGGLFATTDDDELARIIPLVIGYDREPHARPILAGVRGAGLPVRVL